MKKFLLGIILFVAATMYLKAEAPVIFKTPIDTVYGTIEDDDLIAFAQIINHTDKSVDFNIIMDFVELKFGHEAALCWEICFDYTDKKFISPETYTLAANTESNLGQFTGHLHPYKRISLEPLIYSDPVPGTSIVKYTIIPVGGTEEDASHFTVIFIVKDPLSVNDFDFSINELYPNPAKDIISIDLANSFETNSIIEIFDISGNMLKSINISAGLTQENINISDLANGTYYLNLRNGNKQMTKKFSVAR